MLYFQINGKQIKFTEENGIDILGNMVEASKASINSKLYGDMHNMGHFVVSFCHDPDGRYLEDFCVMGDGNDQLIYEKLNKME